MTPKATIHEQAPLDLTAEADQYCIAYRRNPPSSQSIASLAMKAATNLRTAFALYRRAFSFSAARGAK